MKNFILKLFSTESIRNYIRAQRAKERAEIEKFYLQELAKQRKRYQSACDSKAKESAKKYKEKLQEMRSKDQSEIKTLKEKIKRLEAERDSYLSAVAMVSPYAHKLQSFASLVQVKSWEIYEQKARDYKDISHAADDIDTVIRQLGKLAPKIEKIIKIDRDLMEE